MTTPTLLFRARAWDRAQRFIDGFVHPYYLQDGPVGNFKGSAIQIGTSSAGGDIDDVGSNCLNYL